MSKPLKIMALPVDTGGCGWYRVRQPFNMINEFTDTQCHVVDQNKDDMVAVGYALSKADIIVMRQGSEIGMNSLRQLVKKMGKESGRDMEITAKLVYDIDDNIEMISPYSEHYAGYGLKEFTHDGKLVWKNDRDGFNIENNKKRVASLMKGLTEADMVTVTTEKLREYALQYNDNVHILPNVVNLAKWWELPLKPNKQLRVGWSGGMSHYEDWFSIREPLNAMLRKHRFTLVLVGSGFTGLIDDDLKDLVEVHPWVPFEAHSFHMMAMNLDLAIIPLADIPFNNYKSSIKYFEFSAIGVPCLIAGVTPYKEVAMTKMGETIRAAIYHDDKSFATLLEALLEGIDTRKDIGRAAKKYVTENWSAKAWASKYVDIYSTLFT